MLTERETAEILHEMALYEHKRAACIDALKIVQRSRGWVSDEHLADVAEVLGMSVDELDAVATFYNLIYRRPVGRHVVHVCDSVSCWLLGADRISEALRARFGAGMGETTGDGRFTVLTIPCLGACDRAPAIYVDGNLHDGLDAADLEQVLERYE